MSNSILDHPIISSRYFFPRYEKFDNPYFVDCGDANLACYYHRKHENAKTVIHFHGNGEVVADYLDFLPAIFENKGFNLLLFEFRGYGMSTGEPALVNMLGDFEYVIKQLAIPESDLIFFGRSVGSLYAIHAASIYTNANALILESGIADIEERIMLRINKPDEIDSTKEELKEEFDLHFDAQRKLASFMGKSLVLHTINDQLVGVEHGKQLFDYLNNPKKIHLFERGDHNTIFMINQKEYFEILFEFLIN